MLLFNLLVIHLYLVLNIVLVTFRAEHEPIYEDFDWYHSPMTAVISYLVLIRITIVIFVLLWAYTMLVKMPAYREKDDERLRGLGGSENSRSKYLDVSPKLAKRGAAPQKSVDLNKDLDCSRISVNITKEVNPMKVGDGQMSSAQYMGYGVDPALKPLNASVVTGTDSLDSSRKLSP